MDEPIRLIRGGVPWREEQYVQLPRHWTVGYFKRWTAWGMRERNPFGCPAGCWLAGDDLRAGTAGIPADMTVSGVRFPARSLTIVDAHGGCVIDIATGFVVGALVEMAGGFRWVYVVLERGDDGRWRPRVVEPTAAWLRRHA